MKDSAETVTLSHETLPEVVNYPQEGSLQGSFKIQKEPSSLNPSLWK